MVVVTGRGYEEAARLESAHDGRPMLTLVYRRLGADGLGSSHEET